MLLYSVEALVAATAVAVAAAVVVAATSAIVFVYANELCPE